MNELWSASAVELAARIARKELSPVELAESVLQRIDDHNGQKMSVFFLIAPDGLCFYFHQPISETAGDHR